MATVLLCDDSMFARHMTRRMLSQEFEIVGEAEDGQQAVEQYAALKPDLLLVDLVMQRLSGTEAIKRIIADYPDAKIVVCSAMGQEQLVAEAIAAGAKGFVVKPANPEKLAAVLGDVLA